MESIANETVSLWMPGIVFPETHPLQQDLEADVCVVGAGIAGISSAYLLQKSGKRVVVLESKGIASGQTQRTSAHLTCVLDHLYADVESDHGQEGARLTIASHKAAVEKIAEIVRTEAIDCEFERVTGYLFAGQNDSEKTIAKELDVFQRAGVQDVHVTLDAPEGFFSTGPCLVIPEQAQFHPLKYLRGLTEAFLRNGGQIFTNSHVIDVKGGERAFAQTNTGYTVHAEAIVVATNTPVNDRFTMHTKQAPYRTYVVSFAIPKNSLPKVLLWDTEDPNHYIRIYSSTDHDVLLVGGEDHKTGQDDKPEERFERLKVWAKARFPQIDRILYEWSGQVMESVDLIGFLGRNPGDKENIYIITGDSGNGLTNSTIGAMIVRDLVTGQSNPWTKLYEPKRLPLHSVAELGEFLKENLNVAAQYRDWIAAHPGTTIDDLPHGEGTVINQGAKKVAVFRNELGALEFYSAVCPHLGGIVRWNAVEKSWDCPCHGSRFNCHGKVIEGPAVDHLRFLDTHMVHPDEQTTDDDHQPKELVPPPFDKTAVV